MVKKNKRRDLLTSALKDAFKDAEIEETDITEVKSVKIINSVDDEIYSENLEENRFLLEKKVEILNIQANASLDLGRIFEEVSVVVPEKMYIKWLEGNGYNRVTAFRHRRRFKLYEQLENTKDKEIIARCTYREIDKIVQKEEVYLNILIGSSDYKEFKEKLLEEVKEVQIVLPIENKREERETFTEYQNLFGRLNEAMGSLKSSEKEKIDKYIKKINEILKKVEN